MNTVHDQPYGEHTRQKVDVYYPRKPSAIVVIFWHGGSWQRGDKKTYRFIGRSLAKLGYTAVLPNYRLYPEVSWPVFAEDAAHAVAWVRRELKPSKLVVMGHSAGGQIAASVAFDGSYLAAAGVKQPADGFIGLAGAYSFTPAKSLRPVLETSDKAWQTPALVAAKPVPSLLVHGQIDAIIPAGASKRLGKQLRDEGGEADTVIYPHLNHFTILTPFLIGWWTLPSLKRRLAAFVDSR